MPPREKSRLVLVVDDEALIRLCVADLLADNGHAVLEAADGETALALLHAHPEVDVLLTDINMPGPTDGLVLANAARQLRPSLHILVTSGRLAPPTTDLPGNCHFIAKPYHSDLLLRAIERP